METLTRLADAVAKSIQDPSVTRSEIIDVLNRGQLEIAGGATRGYDLPTLPGLPELSTDFSVITVPGSNSTTMPAEFHRGGQYGFAENNDELTNPGSLSILTRNHKRDPVGAVTAFTVFGNNLYYYGSPSVAETLTIHGFRLPVDMVDDSDTPDGIPSHLQYRLLFNYACMELFGFIEQGINESMTNFNKHSVLYGQALTDLQSAIPKDELDECVQNDWDNY